MSNPIKAIGKVFKAVVKVVKKIAIPVLAIGAAVVTGGAALGLLPSLGSIAGGLGLSAGLTTVLTTAGQGALLGMGAAAITGKSILKGATAGFVTGGVLGGLGAATGLSGTAANGGVNGAANGTASTATSTISPVAEGLGSAVTNGSLGTVNGAVTVAPTISPAALANAASAPLDLGLPALKASTGLGGALKSVVSAPFDAFGKMHPYTQASVIQGVGNGISSYAQAKAEREKEERDRQQIEESYSSIGSSWAPQASAGLGSAMANSSTGRRYVWQVDPKTGDVFQKAV